MGKRKKRLSKELTITGQVIATDWDLNDGVNEISIETEDDEYVVEDNSLWEDLFDNLDEEVEVTGVITEDGDATKYIMVTSYKLLESDDDYDEFMN